MKRLDRILLVTAYVLLVGVVAFLSYDVDRKLDENRRVACDTTAAQIAVAQANAVTAEYVLIDLTDDPEAAVEFTAETSAAIDEIIDSYVETCDIANAVPSDPEE